MSPLGVTSLQLELPRGVALGGWSVNTRTPPHLSVLLRVKALPWGLSRQVADSSLMLPLASRARLAMRAWSPRLGSRSVWRGAELSGWLCSRPGVCLASQPCSFRWGISLPNHGLPLLGTVDILGGPVAVVHCPEYCGVPSSSSLPSTPCSVGDHRTRLRHCQVSPGGSRREAGDGSSHSVQSSACSLLIPPIPEPFPVLGRQLVHVVEGPCPCPPAGLWWTPCIGSTSSCATKVHTRRCSNPRT